MAGEDWFESEEPTRLGMISEVQRIRRRTRARPLPVIVLAVAISAYITYKLATHQAAAEAEVVLALTEGSLAQQRSTAGIPVEELHDFVANVLLPNTKLLALIERRNLYPIRKKLGNEFALDGLRGQIDIQISRNTFVSDEELKERSARIGITVVDADPLRAFELARDVAAIVIETSQDQRVAVTKHLTAQVNEMRDRLHERFDKLSRETAEKEAARRAAHEAGNEMLAQALELELAVVWREQKKAAQTLTAIASSRDAVAEQITIAGLDMNVTIVDEHRANQPEARAFLVMMVGAILLIISLLVCALVLGAFDSRVHDMEDVERLDIPVLGHLPGFAGDHVGSLQSRGAARARVTSFSRWRSHS